MGAERVLVRGVARGFPRLQEIADSRDLFGEVVGKLLPGARDEAERALTQESERKRNGKELNTQDLTLTQTQSKIKIEISKSSFFIFKMIKSFCKV